MKTYEQMIEKAKKDLKFSFCPGRTERQIEDRQERADFILGYILEMTTDQMDEIWEEAKKEYDEAHA